MKIKATGSWVIELISTSQKEDSILRATWRAGHVHFVCKAIRPNRKTGRAHLVLSPSLFAWVMVQDDRFYDVAKSVTLGAGYPWTDPRTGEKHMPKKATRRIPRKARRRKQ